MKAGPDADPYVPGHGDPAYAVARYELELSYRVVGNRLTGRATITARALTELDRFALDLHGLQATRVLVDGRPPAKHRHTASKLRIRLAAPIPAGASFTVVIGYHGNPGPMQGPMSGPDGNAGWEELEDGVIVASQPHGAPTWFPCNDRAGDKAAYHFTISAPSAYRVVANGRLLSSKRGASSTTWEYEQPEPMSPYLATLQLGQYAEYELPALVPMSVVLPPDRAARLEPVFTRQPEMLAAFVEMFGDYPFSRYTAVVTDDELEIPLEAQTLSIFGSNFLGDTWANERLVAHELAHQWFGNSLTAASWSDIWLHEGFACYAEWLWSERSGRDSADQHARHHWQRLSGLPQDLVLTAPGAADMFDDRVYKRGALTLHALRRALGDMPFFSLLRSWTSTHAYGTVTTADFLSLAEVAAGRDLTPLLDPWLREPALPPLP
ncbi:MAG: M1 family metallopeptidase [Nocardioidaceae bacterium]